MPLELSIKRPYNGGLLAVTLDTPNIHPVNYREATTFTSQFSCFYENMQHFQQIPFLP